MFNLKYLRFCVQPFASLIDRVPNNYPRLLINREKSGQRTGLMAMMGMGGGLEFDSSKNTRDVCWLGDCDDGCKLLAEKLGWKKELAEIFEEEHQRIDQKEGNAKDSPKLSKPRGETADKL